MYIFFLLGLILLVAMVGSIVLVLNQNVNIRRQFIFKQVLKELKSSVILKN
jgi:cytochrome c556